MKCSVTLDNGKKNGLFKTEGELNLGELGFAIFYSIDGDKCILSYAEGSIVQERHGSVNMVMRFTQGKETKCSLTDGGKTGSFSVYTSRIDIKNDEKSVAVKLNYVCGGESVTLKITAE